MKTAGVFEHFFCAGEVAEIRALGLSGKSKAWEGYVGNGAVAGYFNDPQAFARCAADLDAAGASGVYFTLNPVAPDLLARAANRCKASPSVLKATTKDANVACLRWLYVDIDPQMADGTRRVGMSSGDEELETALSTAKAVAGFLEEGLGFARGLRGFSGNGFHVLYRLPDLANTPENKDLLKRCLEALAARFSTPQVDIDATTFNPARICKLYGTMARKGDSVPERPHRLSYLFKDQPLVLAEVPVTPAQKLAELAALAPVAEVKKEPGPGMDRGPIAPNSSSGGAAKSSRGAEKALGPIDVGRWLDFYGVAYKVDAVPNGKAYRLEKCVFDPSHGPNEASIYHTPGASPFLTYQCFHNSCRGYTFKDARAAISGSDKLAQFCEGYDPNWRRRYERDDDPVRNYRVVPSAQTLQVSCSLPPLPPPDEVEVGRFFKTGEKGRDVFVPLYLANYLALFYGPIVCTNGIFWRYSNGVWSVFPQSTLEAAATRAMDEKTSPDAVNKAITTLARLINKEEEEWEDCRDYINCANGMIDIARLMVDEDCLVPHDPKFGSRVQVPCNYNPAAEWDLWAKLLLDVFPGDLDAGAPKQALLQQFFGYCFLPDCRYNKALFLYGTGANGKSTVMNVLEHLVSKERVSTLTIGELGQRFKSQFLEGKLVNLATETNTRDPLSTEIFKAAVAGDPITAERKYGEPYQFRNLAKFVMAMNDTPVIPDKSYGLERRLLVIDFPRRFEEHEMDTEMAQKLCVERDGIFFWAIMGLRELLCHNGFILSAETRAEKSKFLKGIYPLLNFAEEEIEFGDPEYGYQVHTPKMYERYKTWCSEGGNRAMSRNKFYDQLLMNFPRIKREQSGSDRLTYFIGVRLRSKS